MKVIPPPGVQGSPELCVSALTTAPRGHLSKVNVIFMVKARCQRNLIFLVAAIRSTYSAKGRSTLTIMVLAAGKNCLPQGQIWKSTQPYCVVPHIKALDECFQAQVYM
jgi:hypothetical protein